jgi:hypothetical protein
MLCAADVLDAYEVWLDRQALAPRIRSAYRRWVIELLEHLSAGDELDAFCRRRVVTIDVPFSLIWRRRLVDRRLAPSTVTLALAAATSLLDSRALPRRRCGSSRPPGRRRWPVCSGGAPPR